MFGFEIKIMDKCCVCSKQHGSVADSCVKSTRESVLLLHRLHMDCIHTANGVHVNQVKKATSHTAHEIRLGLCLSYCATMAGLSKTKIQCMNKHLDVINYIFLKISKKCPPPPLKQKKSPLTSHLMVRFHCSLVML